MIQKFAALFCFVACLGLPVLVLGQNVLKETGIQKLKVFVGTWRGAGPDSEKISAVNTIRLSSNGRFIIADQLVTNHGVTTNNLSIYSYDSADRYTLTLVGIKGMGPFTVPITCHGDTLIYEGGNTNRTLNIFETTKKYKYLIQTSADGGQHWKTVGEGWSLKIGD